MNRYKASSYATFNGRLATRYDRSFGPWFCRMRRWDDAVLGAIGPRLDGARVLDVGCASGRLLARISSRAEYAAGADLAPRILETAHDRLAASGLDADLRVADAEVRLPWPAGCFDVITLTGVLHHLRYAERALAEIRRVVSEGGRLIVVDPCFFPPARQLGNALLRLVPVQGDYRFRSVREAVRLVEGAGFGVDGARRVAVWSYLVTASA